MRGPHQYAQTHPLAAAVRKCACYGRLIARESRPSLASHSRRHFLCLGRQTSLVPAKWQDGHFTRESAPSFLRVADHTSEAGARTIGRFRSTRGAVGCDEPEHVAAHGPHRHYHGDASQAGERTKGARPPNEDRRYGELRLSIAQVGRGAPPSKSISMSVREFANAGNVIAVLRSVVSITSPESPTNTYRPSRL